MSKFCTETRACALRKAFAMAGIMAVANFAHGQVALEAGVLAAGKPSKAAPGKAKPAQKVDAERLASKAAMPGTIELGPQISLPKGKSSIMRLPYPATRISVGDAQIADVVLLSPKELYMLGKSVGSTNLIFWNKANDATIIDISVGIDTSALQARFTQLLPDEKNIKISFAADSVVLSGSVSDVAKLDQILALANAYEQRSTQAEAAAGAGASGAAKPQQNTASKVINMLAIDAPQQVMLEVKIAEVSKTLVDQFGASLGLSATRGSWTYSLLSNLLSGKPGVLDGFNNKNGNFATLDAQKRDGLIKVLAEPTIMAISGQEASFLAGGKIFIPVSRDTGTTQTIHLEEKEFGIAVKFTPTVLAGGRINLKVAPEVSDLNREGIGISVSGSSNTAILPSFTTRRATTTVQLFDGQSFAIGGLIKNNVTTNIKAFPLLGEIPVLGALFRSSDFQTDRSELVFIVTPHLVKPLPADYRLPTDNYIEPTRSEFFLGGKMEGAVPPQSKQAGQQPASAPVAAPTAAPTGFELK